MEMVRVTVLEEVLVYGWQLLADIAIVGISFINIDQEMSSSSSLSTKLYS